MHKPHAFQKGFACQQTDTFDQMNDQSLRQFLFSRTHAAPPSITFSQSERLKSTIGVGTDILKHIIGPSIFVSAGGAISFGAVKSVLSDAQQFYWMNNLCSQSERSCWYCLYSLGEGPASLIVKCKAGDFLFPCAKCPCFPPKAPGFSSLSLVFFSRHYSQHFGWQATTTPVWPICSPREDQCAWLQDQT